MDHGTAGMETDEFFLDGDDPDEVERAMNAKIAEIRGKGGEVSDVSFTRTTAGDQPWGEARFNYQMAADGIAEEVEYDPDSVEDPAHG